MNKTKHKLVPELRFPEFKGSADWKRTSLGKITSVISNRNKKNEDLPVYSINNKEGFLPQSKQFEGINSKNRGYDISLYKIVKKNTFAYNPARINIGSIGYSGNLEDVIISSLYVCFKSKTEINDHFLNHFFKSTEFLKEVRRNTEGGIRSYLFYKSFSNIKVFIPSIPEQQKIAACLSSLDDLITAHKDKLDVLHRHKKGLLQNLFPKEGQKVPDYRFEEFLDDGEWVEKKLGDTTKITTGATPTSTTKEYWNGTIPWMSSGELNNKRIYSVAKNITEKGLKESSTKIIPKECVLIGLAGQGKTRGTAAINYIELCTNQSIASIHPNEKHFLSEFLYYKIDSMYRKLRRLSTGQGGRGGLNLSIIKNIIIPFPTNQEQQKIANFLLSVDELIIAQKDKIDQLEQQKKGMLQKLFPKLY